MQLSISILHRSPVKVISLPLIAWLYKLAYSKHRKLKKRLVGKPARFLFKLLHRVIGLKGQGELKLNDTLLSFDGRNTQFHSIYLPHHIDNYETEVTCLIDHILSNNGNFLDIGSNWGIFSFHAATKPGYKGMVHAFEPVAETFNSMESLVNQAGMQSRISCHPFALSDSSSEKRMQIEDSIHSGIASISENGQGEAIACKTLDSLHLNNISLMKIDVEGHEAQALEGARETISACRPYIIFENWINTTNPEAGLEPLAFLEAENYLFFHPTWKVDNGFYPVSPKSYQDGDVIDLSLTGFSSEQRCLLKKQINIFACPEEKAGTFEQKP